MSTFVDEEHDLGRAATTATGAQADELHDETVPPSGEEPRDEASPRPDAVRDESYASQAPGGHAEGRRGSRLENLIPDIVRRTFYAGLGAVFTTEEGIRKIASDLKLPKDVANYLIQSAASTKDELFRIVAKELRGFLESVNVSGELQKLLTSLSFEIKTEIRFIPNEQAISGVKPDLKVGRMSIKRGKKDSDSDKNDE
jgi:hypothetical protein